ncbi:MAG: glycosyltransferase family 2 protein [Burkholderiales bacterium]
MIPAPRVSVVVPCFNYGHFLAECLDSVRAQTFQNWECIVIDDGSTDDTSAVAHAYAGKDERYACVRQENRGLSAARNAGMRGARGDYIQLLDADDLLEERKLEQQVALLDRHRDCALVYGGMRYFQLHAGARVLAPGRNSSAVEWMKMWRASDEAMLAAMVEGNQFPVSAALFRRAVLVETGYFDEALRSHEDWEFWLRWAFSRKRFFGEDLPGTRTLIREHSQSLTRSTITMAETRLAVRKRIERLAQTEDLRAKNRECASYDQCELGAAEIAAGRLRTGMRRYATAFASARRKARAIQLLLVQLAPRWLLAAWWGMRRCAATRMSG